jgi:uncharacterized protein with HEPN domain
MSSDKDMPHAIITARHNIALIQQWWHGISYDDFKNDIMRRYAIQYAFISIGECIEDISRDSLLQAGPEIPWRKITGFRDWLAHTYDDLPDSRIIETIDDLPSVDAALVKLLNILEVKS